MVTKEYGRFKAKLTKNFNKILLSLALIGAVTGTIALIVGSVAISQNKTNGMKYFFKKDGTAVWGNSTIWVYQPNDPQYWSLYFDFEKQHDADIVWDGTYPEWYFNNKK